jgi:hypothetical protein
MGARIRVGWEYSPIHRVDLFQSTYSTNPFVCIVPDLIEGDSFVDDLAYQDTPYRYTCNLRCPTDVCGMDDMGKRSKRLVSNDERSGLFAESPSGDLSNESTFILVSQLRNNPNNKRLFWMQ